MGQYEQERNYLNAERQALIAELAAGETRAPKYIFSIGSELVVVGHNPEAADFDNPKGQLIEERFFMVATDADGRQFSYGSENTPEKAERAFQHLAPAVELWPFYRCVYGSLAYMQEGCELAGLQAEMEADLGPEWYRHPDVQHYPSEVLV